MPTLPNTLLIAALAPALAHALAHAQADALPLRHTVAASTVTVGEGGIASMEFDKAFRYVGGHRFILARVADVEQHAFAAIDAAGKVQRYYWIQFERYLPSSNGRYDYNIDSLLLRGGREWRMQPRRYTARQTNLATDGGQLYALFTKAKLDPPIPAGRIRLVHMMSPDNRAELMIIYAETSLPAVPMALSELTNLIDHAFAGIHFR